MRAAGYCRARQSVRATEPRPSMSPHRDRNRRAIGYATRNDERPSAGVADVLPTALLQFRGMINDLENLAFRCRKPGAGGVLCGV
jgi:hypothetical protein